MTMTMQNLSKLIDAMSMPSALADDTGRIVAHNHAFLGVCTGKDKVLNGKHLRDVLSPLETEAFDNHLNTLKGAANFVTTPGKGLIFKTIETETQLLFLCQGKLPQLEDQLLHFFRDQADQGFWDYDVQTDHFAASEAWRTMRGYDLDEKIGPMHSDWLNDVHPQDRERLKNVLRSQMDGDTKTLKFQYRRRHLKTNEWIWIYCRSQAIATGPNGRATRIVGTDTDITEVKLDENRLARLNNKIELAVESSGIGIWEFDLNTQRVFWDDRLLAMYGLPAGENDRPQTDWGSFIHPEDADEAIAYAEECALTQSDVKHDFRIIRVDGEIRHIRTMARFVDVAESETKLIGVNIDVTEDVMRAQELERARAQLEFESQHDALTGLANRRLMNETISKAMETHSKMCMMHIDLDYFKEINDTLGHAAGDAVLVHVANTLKQILTEALLICRLGGDEFSIIFAPAPSEERIKELGERVIDAFQHPYIFESNACPISLSIGAATGWDVETVYSHADIALYAAKNAGRSRFRAYTDRTGERATGLLRRRQDLADAIAEGKIECWYQPQFEATSHRLVGAEALARLRARNDVLWAPDEFLPLAEETGLLIEIEELMFNRVLADQSRWAKAGLCYPSISVNISQNRLAEKNLIERITKQLEPHHLLSLEVLETAFLDDPDAPTLQKLEELRALGFGIDLDDFGSGHASVVSMLAINPDKIKIDQRLTKDIAHSQSAAAILKAMVAIGRAQGVGIVLEGIETAEQLQACQDIDCDVLQGFALSAPITATEFGLMLEKRTRQRIGAP